jgi:4-hydroxy-3-methylbut-2-enyl diphosphate reductase
MIDEQKTPESAVEGQEEPKVEATATATQNEGVAPSQEPAEAAAPEAAAPEAAAPVVETPVEAAPAVEAEAPAVEAEAPAPAAPAEEAPKAEAGAEKTQDAPAESGSKTDQELFEEAMASMGSDDTKETGGSGKINRGDRIQATVIQVEKDKVFVNIGGKSDGVVPLKELTDANVDTAVGVVAPGDTFEVIVIKTQGAEGNPIVSKRRADFDVAWKKILAAFEEGELFQAQVVDRVKGGLVVDIGVRGFVPASHVGGGRIRNIEKFVGETLPVKIIEIDRERRKVVLSNRQAETERKDDMKKDLFSKVAPGDKLPGTVRRLTDYGAFVDLGGIDGLLHISEMSWMRIDHPKEVLKEGDEIEVMILRLDENSGRISLGLRQVLPDPWKMIKENYKAGTKVKVTVGRMVQSGVFIRLPEQAEAFLPLSEISDQRIKKPSDELEIGQEIEPTIIDLRPDERRMVLSLREGAGQVGYRFDDLGGIGARRRGGQGGGGRRRRNDQADFDTTSGSQRVPTGGATIGERLGMLKGILGDAPKPEAAPEKAPKKKAPKAEAPKAEAPKAEAPEAEAPKAEAPKAEAPKTEEPAASESES